MKKILIALTVFMTGFVLVGCGRDEMPKVGSELVGTWRATREAFLTWKSPESHLDELTFNGDGTGFAESKDREVELSYSFNWTVNGEVILICSEDGGVEEWVYSIGNGTSLIITLVSEKYSFPFPTTSYERVD